MNIYLIIISILFFPNLAYAYLDPGSGSILIQILLVIVAFFTTIYLYFKNMFISFISKVRKLFKFKSK